MTLVSTGCEPLRVSQKETRPLYEPPTSRNWSFALYSRQQHGETGWSAISGSLGLLTSQMYDAADALSIRQSWNCMIANETAIFLPPSGNHEIFVAVRLTSEGSLKAASVLADGLSLACPSAASSSWSK